MLQDAKSGPRLHRLARRPIGARTTLGVDAFLAMPSLGITPAIAQPPLQRSSCKLRTDASAPKTTGTRNRVELPLDRCLNSVSRKDSFALRSRDVASREPSFASRLQMPNTLSAIATLFPRESRHIRSSAGGASCFDRFSCTSLRSGQTMTPHLPQEM
jgi:hypothetical protein